MAGFLYLLFFLSGVSGLIYQVVWVRVFGNVFGNTVHSASLVVAIFMLGLGAGSFIGGVWADRRYAARPDSLLRAYGMLELLIAGLGLAIAAALPHLGSNLGADFVVHPRTLRMVCLSAAWYVARAAIAVVLLTPITLLMGGTLTLLIRHLVRQDLAIGGWRIAVLYTVNTAGAAAGALLTDFALVPASGLRGTQVVAVVLNVVAGGGALYMAFRLKPEADERSGRSRSRRLNRRNHVSGSRRVSRGGPACDPGGHPDQRRARPRRARRDGHGNPVVPPFHDSARRLPRRVLAAAGGDPHRHGAGSLAGGFLQRRTGRAGELFMLMQGCSRRHAARGWRSPTCAPSTRRRCRQSGRQWRARRALVQRGPDAPGSRAARVADGLQLSAGERHRPAGGAARSAVVPACLYLANTAGAVCGILPPGSSCSRRSACPRAPRSSWPCGHRHRAAVSCDGSRSRIEGRGEAAPPASRAPRRRLHWPSAAVRWRSGCCCPRTTSSRER